jgi:hypothetical protein
MANKLLLKRFYCFDTDLYVFLKIRYCVGKPSKFLTILFKHPFYPGSRNPIQNPKQSNKLVNENQKNFAASYSVLKSSAFLMHNNFLTISQYGHAGHCQSDSNALLVTQQPK